ncbi:hypothetical protein EV126DRAFT_424378 [Verticillium dahliae]|nr:hypothetical protein EV126DRAFT_436554 [Verticillium dahliae]KAH6699630.1 hypothetical protein EV126DRAFT_424378 [Verticillium dahliae]
MGRARALIACSISFTRNYPLKSVWSDFSWIRRQIEDLHGQYIHDLEDPLLTHLVTSQSELSDEEGFTRYISRKNWKGVHIVSYDWLQECLRTNTKIDEGPYRLKVPARMGDPEYSFYARRRLKESKNIRAFS